MARILALILFLVIQASIVGPAMADVAEAWKLYEEGRYEEALAGFEKEPGESKKKEAALGAVYSLLKLGRVPEALSKASDYKSDLEFAKVIKGAHMSLGTSAYEAERFGEAAAHFEKVIEIDPEDAGARELLAWSLYNSGKYREGAPHLAKMFEADGSPDIAAPLLNAYALGCMAASAQSLAQKLSESDEPGLRGVASEFFLSRSRPLLALGAISDPTSCHFNFDKPSLSIDASHRHKSGDKGTSLLDESALTLAYRHPLSNGYELELSAKAVRLDAGEPLTAPFAGSFFNQPQTRALHTELTVFEPSVVLRKEGAFNYVFGFGLTPLGADASATPIMRASIYGERMSLHLHREPVDESILSYAGLEDPYGTEVWGRVLRTGIEAEYDANVSAPYWLTLNAGYDFYDGENVIENSSFGVGASFGRVYELGEGEFAAGVFAEWQGFEENSNFYTFGHGGYFSPERFFVIGPVLRYLAKPCEGALLDVSASAGYLDYSTASAPHYPTIDPAGPSYASESFSGLGYGFDLEAQKLLSKRTAIKAFLNVSKSADYTEWQALIGLDYYFADRDALFERGW